MTSRPPRSRPYPRVVVADAELRERIEGAVRDALRAVGPPPPCPRVLRVATLRRTERLGGAVAGALVMIEASDRNARRLRRMVAALETNGCAGVQIVCPAEPSAVLGGALFAILEERRGKAGHPPVVLATDREPVEVLLRSAKKP